MRVLGIDLGTGSVKAAVVEADGRVTGLGTTPHRVEHPAPGAAEIAPDAWLASVTAAVRAARAAAHGGAIDAVGLSGQMHGVVCVDAAGDVLRPALLWPDTRAAAACARYRRLPPAALRTLGNPVVPGMFGPLLAMALAGDRGLRGRLRWALSPKDWLRLALTGVAATEPSDASATLLWDVTTDTWSPAALEAMGLPRSWLPPVDASDAQAGALHAAGGDLLGLPEGTPVAAGAADTAAALHGTGLQRGDVQVSVGTGAQIVAPLDDPSPAADPVTHRYRRAGDGWYAMAAMQNAGLALDWVRDVMRADWDEMHAALTTAPPGCGGVTFHAYLTGERTPVLDPHARAAWQGLAAHHDRATLLRAASEGVAFAVRDGLEALDHEGIPIGGPVRLAGGGTDDPHWRTLLATVLGRPLQVHRLRHVSVVGAARLAAAAVGGHLPAARDDDPQTVGPDPAASGALDDAYARWQAAKPT